MHSILHQHPNRLSKLHATIIATQNGHQLCSHTLFQAFKGMEVKLHLSLEICAQWLRHEVLTRACQEYFLDVASLVHIFNGQLAVHNTRQNFSCTPSSFWQYKAFVIPACSIWRTCLVPMALSTAGSTSRNSDEMCARDIAQMSCHLPLPRPISANFIAASHIAWIIHVKKYLRSGLHRLDFSNNS